MRCIHGLSACNASTSIWQMEACLRFIFMDLAEGMKECFLQREQGPLNPLLMIILQGPFISISHIHVRRLLYDIFVRYASFLTQQREALPMVFGSFLDTHGIQSESNHSKACYMLHRCCLALGTSCISFLPTLSEALIPALGLAKTPTGFVPLTSPLILQDVMHLYELMGNLGKYLDSNSNQGEKAVEWYSSLISPLLQHLQALPSEPVTTRSTYWSQLLMLLGHAIRDMPRGQSHLMPLLDAVASAQLPLIQACAPLDASIYTPLFSLCHTLIEVMRIAFLNYFQPILSSILAQPTLLGIKETLSFVNQAVERFPMEMFITLRTPNTNAWLVSINFTTYRGFRVLYVI